MPVASLLCLLLCLGQVAASEQDLLIEDFEADSYRHWRLSGWSVDAFSSPLQATDATAAGITGFAGNGMASSRNYENELHAPWATRTQGVMLSEEFTIERDFINFLIGGGEYHWRVSLNLLDGEKAIRTTTGPGDKRLVWRSWDVSRLKGKKVRLRLLDGCFDELGFILVDQIQQSNQAKGAVGGDPGYASRMMRAEVAKNQQDTFQADKSDPLQYTFHYSPPGEMTDPHGAMFYNGYYHLFYQNHAFAGRRGNNKHWGHARSKDFVHWELLPPAVYPSYDLGETNCFSGCSFMGITGQPMIFYTMVPLNEPREQWLALAQDEDLIEWTKSNANPMLALDEHDGPRFVDDWRDPFVFSEAGKTFMVLTANVSVPIYEALNDDLTRWAYRGNFYSRNKIDLIAECPGFFRIEDKWVLLYSSYKEGTLYVIGDFDPHTAKFHVEQEGFLDHNDASYAVYPMIDPDGRCVLYGNLVRSKHVNHGSGRQGLTLARQFALGEDGLPRQTPLVEFQKLRGPGTAIPSFEVNDAVEVMENIQGNALEIIVEIEPVTARAYGLRVHLADDGSRGTVIRFDGTRLNVAGFDFPFQLTENENVLKLHVFVDKGVLDVFVNDGRAAETRLAFPAPDDLGVAVFSEGGMVRVRSLQAWKMKSIW